MLLPRFVAGIFSVGMMAGTTVTVHGQNYPSKPLRIVTTEAGGSSDFAARLIAQALTVNLGQPVIVENRPSGVTSGEIVSKARADGYTVLLGATSFWIGPLLQKMPYDTLRDFAPIILATRSPNILVVHPSLPVKSVKELIAYAKAKPGDLNYSSAGTGGSAHLAVELFKSMAGIDIVRINYKGTGPGLNALIANQVQMTISSSAAVTPQIKAGRLTALAVTSAQPSALSPGMPTVAASGLPGYEWATMIGIFAPAKTPVAIINRLNQEIRRVLNQVDVKERFFNSGVEAVGSSPDEFGGMVKADVAKMGKVIKDAGIQVE